MRHCATELLARDAAAPRGDVHGDAAASRGDLHGVAAEVA